MTVCSTAILVISTFADFRIKSGSLSLDAPSSGELSHSQCTPATLSNILIKALQALISFFFFIFFRTVITPLSFLHLHPGLRVTFRLRGQD
jgi:hypothetical protein